MQRVLVLGSNGRLGKAIKHVVQGSLKSDYEFEFAARANANLLSVAETTKLFETVRPSIVLNFAAQVSPRVDSLLDLNTSYDASIRVFQNVHGACILTGVSRLFQASSYHLFSREVRVPYGVDFVPSLGELNFENPYSAAKATEFLYASQANEIFSTNTLRTILLVMPNIFGPYGPLDLGKEHFVGASIRRMQAAKRSQIKSIEFFGPPSQIREYLYSIDAAKEIIKLLSNQNEDRFFSVISSGQKFSQYECWSQIAKATGYEGETVLSNSQGTGQDMYFATRSFVPTNFQEALCSTVGWYESSTQEG